MQSRLLLPNTMLTSWPSIRQIRDLSVIALNNKQSLVVACDSAGAIGTKELDQLHVSNYILGRFTVRVALLEVLAAGAMPILICDTLTVEMHPSGEEILLGIKDEIKQLGLAEQLHLTGTTEENFLTRQSGIGITVIGLIDTEHLRLGRAQTDDALLCFGLPKVGSEVNLDDPENVDAATMMRLLAYPEVHEIVPVGSKGIFYEAQSLAASSKKTFRINPGCTLPLEKSAGPATCLVAAVEPQIKADLCRDFALPITCIGFIE